MQEIIHNLINRKGIIREILKNFALATNYADPTNNLYKQVYCKTLARF